MHHHHSLGPSPITTSFTGLQQATSPPQLGWVFDAVENDLTPVMNLWTYTCNNPGSLFSCVAITPWAVSFHLRQNYFNGQPLPQAALKLFERCAPGLFKIDQYNVFRAEHCNQAALSALARDPVICGPVDEFARGFMLQEGVRNYLTSTSPIMLAFNGVAEDLRLLASKLRAGG